MKKIVFVIVAILSSILLSFSSEKKELKDIDFKVIQTELEWFINRVKPESFRQGKHNVYLLNLYECDECGGYCFTIGYIDNYFSFKFIGEYKYYFYEDNELILIDYSDDFRDNFHIINSDCLKLLTNKQVITERIDMEMEAIGTWPGYICCYDDSHIIKVYYKNSDEIPKEKSILKLKIINQGTVIEIDSNTFKKVLKDK